MNDFHRFLAGLNLRHFSPAEVAFLGNSNLDLGLNTEPPPHLWRHIIPTVWIADQAREVLGRPIRILSAYRNGQYNAAIGGASASQHKHFTALDLDPIGTTTGELWDLLYRWRSAGLWRGGLGRYRTFVHIDSRGQNATWGI